MCCKQQTAHLPSLVCLGYRIAPHCCHALNQSVCIHSSVNEPASPLLSVSVWLHFHNSPPHPSVWKHSVLCVLLSWQTRRATAVMTLQWLHVHNNAHPLPCAAPCPLAPSPPSHNEPGAVLPLLHGHILMHGAAVHVTLRPGVHPSPSSPPHTHTRTHLQLTEAGVVLAPRRLVLQVDGEPSPHGEFSRAGIHGNGQDLLLPVHLSHSDGHLPAAGMDGAVGCCVFSYQRCRNKELCLSLYLFVPQPLNGRILNAAVALRLSHHSRCVSGSSSSCVCVSRRPGCTRAVNPLRQTGGGGGGGVRRAGAGARCRVCVGIAWCCAAGARLVSLLQGEVTNKSVPLNQEVCACVSVCARVHEHPLHIPAPLCVCVCVSPAASSLPPSLCRTRDCHQSHCAQARSRTPPSHFLPPCPSPPPSPPPSLSLSLSPSLSLSLSPSLSLSHQYRATAGEGHMVQAGYLSLSATVPSPFCSCMTSNDTRHTAHARTHTQTNKQTNKHAMDKKVTDDKIK